MRNFIKKILLIATVMLAVVYLIACVLPWISTHYFWFCSFIGFAFLYLVMAVVVAIIFWLFFKPKYSLLLLLVLACGYQQINTLFAFNTNIVFSRQKENGALRIISWNVANLSKKTMQKDSKRHTASDFVKEIVQQHADVICLQEFADSREKLPVELIELNKKYPYSFFPFWSIGIYRHRTGNVILSKYPIVFVDSTHFESGNNVIRADIVKNNDTISFYNTHLYSYKFSRTEFNEIDGENIGEENQNNNFIAIAKKVKHTQQQHYNEVDIVNKFMLQTKYPSILCIDMNEVPNNYVYWKIVANKQDAFLQKGFGFGKTYNSLTTPLRIDYIMPGNAFSVAQFNIVDNELSDHKMIIADVIKK